MDLLWTIFSCESGALLSIYSSRVLDVISTQNKLIIKKEHSIQYNSVVHLSALNSWNNESRRHRGISYIKPRRQQTIGYLLVGSIHC